MMSFIAFIKVNDDCLYFRVVIHILRENSLISHIYHLCQLGLVNSQSLLRLFVFSKHIVFTYHNLHCVLPFMLQILLKLQNDWFHIPKGIHMLRETFSYNKYISTEVYPLKASFTAFYFLLTQIIYVP